MGGLVIDDGGSTRIKWLEAEPGARISGIMHGIMSVQTDEKEMKKATQEIQDGPYQQILIVYQDKFGHPDTIPVSSFDSALISSDLKQNVEVVNTGSGLKLTLYGDVIEPVVEARQHDMKRRYIVSNSGRILQVTVTDRGKARVVYDVNTIIPAEKQPVIYTSVVFT
jgi:hypothetical protein